jgi:hypothetical protein
MTAHDSPASATTTTVAPWWRRHATEIVLNLAAILIIPVVAARLWERYSEAMYQFGVGNLMSMLAGNGGWTDIGWEVASAKALVEPGFSAYDSLEAIHPLIGMELAFQDFSSHSHPPMSIPLGLPLVPFDYATWLPYWIVVALLMIAWSMRLLGVPAHLAYPIALLISLTVPGRWGLVSTYPVSALFVSWAWHSRQRWGQAGLAYGLLGATRGIGLLLLLYPLARRQWRAILIALATVAVLLGIALVIEPDALTQWLTTSRASIEANMQRDDLLTLGSILARQEVAEFWAYVIAAVIAIAALWRGSNLFWVLNWVILAVSPIAWFHTVLLGIPLMVMMWRAGRFGRIAVLVIAASAMTQLVDPMVTLVFSITWITFVVASGLTLLVDQVGPREEIPLISRARAAWRPSRAR